MDKITYTTLSHKLCLPVADLLLRCFPTMLPVDQYDASDLEEYAEVFPEGGIVALDGEKVVGMGLGIFADVDPDDLPLLEHDFMYVDDVLQHDPLGDYYYGCDLAVHPDYRGHGIAREIYVRRKAVATEHNKRGFYAAAVLPGFADHKAAMDAQTYVDKVSAGELFDPTLSVQLRNGFRVVKVLHKFFTFPKSDDWCALILWGNPAFVPDKSTK